MSALEKFMLEGRIADIRWILAIVFFPVTIAVIVGYRKGWLTWGLGGQGFEIDDTDDINWVLDHEEREREDEERDRETPVL